MFLKLSAAFVALLVFIIMLQIFMNRYSVISIEFLTEMPRRRMTEGGIYPEIGRAHV